MKPVLKINWWLSGVSGSPATLTTPEIYAFNLYTDKMDLEWSAGADSYVVERATDSGFTIGLTTIYSGASTTFQDTGLASGTTYYYRVRATLDAVTSDYGTDSAKTISFTPVAWWEMTAFDYGVTNDYGKATLFNVDDVYSVVNTSGPDLNFDGDKGAANFQDNGNAYTGLANSNFAYAISSLITLSGDFTIAVRLKMSTPVNHYLLGYTVNANNYIRFQSLTALQIRITTGPYSVTFPSALTANNWYDIVIKRVGTTLYASSDGGVTFSAGTAAVSTALTLNVAFAADLANNSVINATVKRFVIASSELSLSQLNEVFNFEKRTSVTSLPLAASINTKQTFNDLTGTNYLIDTSLSAAATASTYRTRVLSLRDKTFILLHKLADTTYYLEDCLFTYDHTTNKISDIVNLGVPVNNTDVHNNGSIINFNNQIIHLENSIHYDQGSTQTLFIKKSAKDFDLSLPFTQQSIAKGVPLITGQRTQYHQPIVLNDKIYVVHQEFNGTYAQWVSILISSDGGNSWDKYRVIDSAGASEFVYPQITYSENKIRMFVGWIAAAGRYRHQTYIESTDGLTWTNLSGVFSQNVTLNNPINRTNSLASCRVGVDATALAGNVKVGHAFQHSGGEVFCIQGAGDDVGLNLVRGTSGGSFTSQALNFGVHSIVGTWLSADGDNLPFALKTGTDSFDIYVHRTNGGLWEIVKFTTTDGGVNCTFDSIISNDNTKKHWRMYPSKNAMFADNILLAAMRSQTTYGDLFVKEIAI